MSKTKQIIALAIWLAVPLAVGFLSSFFVSSPQTDQYANFIQPPFAPPAWLFGPVWTVLYLLMGAAAFLVWKNGWQKKEVKLALVLFAIQLVFNFFWTTIFFGLGLFGWAFVEILALWVLILIDLILFWRQNKIAGWLFVPYLLWVSFASVLNFSIWLLN